MSYSVAQRCDLYALHGSPGSDQDVYLAFVPQAVGSRDEAPIHCLRRHGFCGFGVHFDYSVAPLRLPSTVQVVRPNHPGDLHQYICTERSSGHLEHRHRRHDILGADPDGMVNADEAEAQGWCRGNLCNGSRVGGPFPPRAVACLIIIQRHRTEHIPLG